jgi:hypothetical protein
VDSFRQECVRVKFVALGPGTLFGRGGSVSGLIPFGFCNKPHLAGSEEDCGVTFNYSL